MQKAEPQHSPKHSQPTARQAKGKALASPQGEQLAQLEAMANDSPQADGLAGFSAMANDSPAATAQRRSIAGIHNSPRAAAQRHRLDTLTPDTAQRAEDPSKPNNTGMPDNLKSGIESLSGMSMDNVRVHYNSPQPAQLNAHAYAQGTDIHVASGQEQHLPHEAWHVVQQVQGRVQPTMQMKQGDVPVNDDKSLEHEADVMGVKAISVGMAQKKSIEAAPADHENQSPQPMQKVRNSAAPLQLKLTIEKYTESELNDLYKKLDKLEDPYKEIAKKWKGSAIKHEFSSLKKLIKALEAAEEMRGTESGDKKIGDKKLPDPPSIFRKACLKFLTKTDDREATLYFNDGTNSARLRQQHSSGPLAQMPRTGKVDYFGDKEYLKGTIRKFAYAKKELFEDDPSKLDGKSVQDLVHERFGKYETLKTGEGHLELWYNDKGELINSHPSGGLVQSADGYSDEDIKKIYSQIVGRI